MPDEVNRVLSFVSKDLASFLMNICLIGDFSGKADEGMKGIAQCLAQQLAKTHRILKVDIHRAFRLDVLGKLSDFDPDVLHYLSGPSPFSFIILRTILFSCTVQCHRNVKTVMSATQPWLPFNFASFLRKIKPDLLLVQSNQSEEYFGRMGFNVKYLANGVNVTKFKPATEFNKRRLRAKYKLNNHQFVVLHIGPIRGNRGLDIMKRIASVDNCLVLIIGSTSSPLEKPIFLDLVKNKCIVRRQYIEAIHEIYQLADLYVFPVEERLGSIEVPLSVLEAMASNLPVISTKFCGLPRMFKEGDGLFFVDNRNEIPKLVGDIIDGNIIYNLDTRSKVLPYSWENISRILCQYYQELVDG